MMAISKKNRFGKREVLLADFARAVSHPARLAILKILVARKSCICGEIVGQLPLSQSTVSQHLKGLKDVGLIQGAIDGPKVCYCINPEGLKRFSTLLTQYLAKLSKNIDIVNDCC